MNTTTIKDPRGLVPPDVFAAVVATMKDNNLGIKDQLAERIVAEALKFVAACGQFRDRRMAPSRVVDEGWHALILHTKAYEDLCAKLGGPVTTSPSGPTPPGSTASSSSAPPT
ncbi:hypothetical protein [Kitasatospora sp. NPDC050543]|uniref:hypothetical protein n=1 Tax=Kitasatospora sp. NPDC050543 TaxID=3364054 RepID=UPI0037877E48